MTKAARRAAVHAAPCVRMPHADFAAAYSPVEQAQNRSCAQRRAETCTRHSSPALALSSGLANALFVRGAAKKVCDSNRVASRTTRALIKRSILDIVRANGGLRRRPRASAGEIAIDAETADETRTHRVRRKLERPRSPALECLLRTESKSFAVGALGSHCRTPCSTYDRRATPLPGVNAAAARSRPVGPAST